MLQFQKGSDSWFYLANWILRGLEGWRSQTSLFLRSGARVTALGGEGGEGEKGKQPRRHGGLPQPGPRPAGTGVPVVLSDTCPPRPDRRFSYFAFPNSSSYAPLLPASAWPGETRGQLAPTLLQLRDETQGPPGSGACPRGAMMPSDGSQGALQQSKVSVPTGSGKEKQNKTPQGDVLGSPVAGASRAPCLGLGGSSEGSECGRDITSSTYMPPPLGRHLSKHLMQMKVI